VNYFTLGRPKICEPLRGKLNANVEGDSNARVDNRRRGRDWPDLVGRSYVRVGPPGQPVGTRTQNAPGGRHVEKIVLLCFLMAVIGVLAEWSPAPQASRPGGHSSPVLESPRWGRALSSRLRCTMEQLARPLAR
jgi:hypothetical protein